VSEGRDDGANEPTGPSGGARPDEDAVWREIVENYGDEPKVEDFPDHWPDPAPGPSLDRWPGPPPASAAEEPEDEGYTPPPPPPLPRPVGLRLVAWLGVFGVPLLVLVVLLTGLSLPSWAGVLCLAWFVGGFGYLVATMPRHDDGDDFDDGARI
jgi:hypothetical protein